MGSSKFINKNTNVVFSLWIIMALQHILPDRTVKGFKRFCMSISLVGTDDMLWNESKKDGDVWSEC
jgi:hypothetical protein